MAKYAIKNSNLIVGINFSNNCYLNRIIENTSPFLVFPHESAIPLEEVASKKSGHLEPLFIIIDGTWTEAKKMVVQSENLHCLPKVKLQPSVPSAYQIRRQPAPQCLSTIEVAAALLQSYGLDQEASKVLKPFHNMVKTQLNYETQQK